MATDVKVAPGGTEDIDSTVYEGVVIAALTDVSHITSSCYNTECIGLCLVLYTVIKLV